MDKKNERLSNLNVQTNKTFKVLTNDYVEGATISLVREYLHKKGFRSTLKSLNHEEGSFKGIHDRRLALSKELRLLNLLKENKSKKAENNATPLESILEVIVKAFIQTNCNSPTKHSKGSQTFPLELNSVSVQCETSQVINSENAYDQEEFESDRTTTSISKVPSHQEQPLSPPTSNSGNKSTGGSRGHSQSLRSHSSIPPESSKNNQDGMSDSSTCSYVEPISPPSISKFENSFENQFHIKRSNGPGTKSPLVSPSSEEGRGNSSSSSNSGSIHSILQSKQDLLAGVSLSRSENKKRNAVQSPVETTQEDKILSEFKVCTSPKVSPSSVKKESELQLCDIEDEDFGYSEQVDFKAKENPLIFIRNPSGKSAQCKNSRLDLKTWRQFKLAILGEKGFLSEGWVAQGFVFNPKIPFGLLQNKGGPCGVLAVVQALILRNLLFGSADTKSEPSNEFVKMLEGKQGLKTGVKVNETESCYEWIVSKRMDALVDALVEILWRCRISSNTGEDSVGAEEVRLCFEGNEPGSNVITIQQLGELKEFVRENIHRFDCIALVYSAALSRGVLRIEEDMDFGNSSLLGQHGYCSQELVNLILFGKCISNAFDNQILLDDKVLKGIEAQSDIGLLSLFEHYGSCEVGSFLKSPKYPIWLVCSESHFSVLFSHNLSLVSREKEQFIRMNGFDLLYYDGLAKQEDIIRLTINFDGAADGNGGGFLSIPNGFPTSTGGKAKEEDDHLIPPLEKCIKTKWKNARVFWNDTEPIL